MKKKRREVSKTGASTKPAPRREPHRGPVYVHAKSSKGCSLSYPRVRSGGQQADVGAEGPLRTETTAVIPPDRTLSSG